MTSISYEKACNLEGFLKKKSPLMFKGYQKRYFMVRDGGKLLAYFTRKPKSGDEPKGVLLLHLISEIEIIDESKFILHYPERPFILRADNPDMQSLWISGLRILSEKGKQETHENEPKGHWKDKKLTEDVAQIVKFESEINSPSPSLGNSTDINIQIMAAKGIWRYFSTLSAKMLKRHVQFGFLNKRSKGTVKYFQKRWFILISGAPIIPTVEEEVLNESGFPPWMYLNHIYYFKYSGVEDDSEAQGEIPTRLVTIRIKDMKNSKDPGASFLLDLGTRIYHLNAENEEVMDTWVKAIDTSKENAQEVTSSITGRPKYIKKLIQLFDSHGPKSLKGKIMDLFKENDKALTEFESLQSVLDQFTKITDDMISTIDGCLSHRPQRLDIAEVYAQTFHKKLCEVFGTIWKSVAPSISNEDIFILIVWIQNYDTQLVSVGINDQKIDNGITVLSTEYARNIFEKSCEVLHEALKKASLGEISIDEDSSFYVVGYGEIISAIEPLIPEIQTCSASQFPSVILDMTYDIITCYNKAVTEICEKNSILSMICIVALCNDSVLIAQKVKSWQTSLKSFIDAAVINAHLKTKKITEETSRLEQLVKNFFTNSLLERINSSFELPFHELHMDVLFPEIIAELNSIEKNTDKVLIDYVWKRLMEETIQKYVNCIFKNKQMLKSQSILLLSETLRSDSSMFLRYFSMKFEKVAVENSLQGLKDIFEFLEVLPEEIAEACMKVKKVQGEDFDFNVAVSFT